MKRYTIEIMFLEDSVKGTAEWKHFYPARSKRTEKGARKEFWYWVNYPWEDHPIFRIYDNKKERAVEL